MKRINNIFEEICSIYNIKCAIIDSSKGKTDRTIVKKTISHIDRYALHIRIMLLNDKYEVSKYKIFSKESGGKIRDIYKLPYYPDRIIQHCIIRVLKPKFLSILIRNTFSTIPSRGIHDGVLRIKKDLKNIEETAYCLKMDVRHFYPSINHNILKEILSKFIKDNRTLSLIFKIIDSEHGVPIGNYISQWFANIYLSYFDHYCKEQIKCKYYYRYCDDIVIFGDNKEKLHYICDNIMEYMKDKLLLKIKDNYQIFPIDKRGVDFLGYRFFHGYILVRKRIVKAMKKAQSDKSKSSYYGWLKHADSYRLIKKYYGDKEILRFCQR